MSANLNSALVGETIDQRYEVQQKIGEGGMGEVFLAVDRRTGRQVALKLPWPGLLGQTPEKDRFVQEIRALSRLDHPHIVKVLDVVECAGRPAQVLQYFSGGTLEQRRDLALESWLPGIAAALDYLHGEGLVHRDVKPANLLVDSQSTVYLADFGIVKLLQGAPKVTQTGYVLGTPIYMAPEAIQGQELDGRSDQYALAMVVYERLAGCLPFATSTPWGIAAAHVSSPPRPLVEVDGRYRQETSAVLARALSKSPAERFGSCREFAGALLSSLETPPAPLRDGPKSPSPVILEQRPAVDTQGAGSATTPAAGVCCDASGGARDETEVRDWWWRFGPPAVLLGSAACIFALIVYSAISPMSNHGNSHVTSDLTDGRDAPALARRSEQGKPGPRPPGEFVRNSIGMQLKLIPAGEFLMGSPDDEALRDQDECPLHRVRITKPFYLGVHEVTQAQYESVMGRNPSQFKGPDHPVENVSWEEARTFCEKLSQLPAEKAARRGYRLPTEAEWEYACRAGTNSVFSFGDDVSQAGSYAWYSSNAGDRTHPGGQKRPNAWGLHDMHGNVWEWCQDGYASDYYKRSPLTDPQGPSTLSHVVRGGSWGGPARSCRSAYRCFTHSRGDKYLGFRVVSVQSTEQVFK